MGRFQSEVLIFFIYIMIAIVKIKTVFESGIIGWGTMCQDENLCQLIKDIQVDGSEIRMYRVNYAAETNWDYMFITNGTIELPNEKPIEAQFLCNLT